MKKLLFIVMSLLTTKISAQNSDFIKMIEYAVKAPSGHNTQPWKIEINDNSIIIYPNFDCKLSVVDSYNRELYISLGCALENLIIAGNQFGYQSYVTIQKEDSIYTIHVLLEKTIEDLSNPLFKYIDKRQTNRNIYKYRIISSDTIQILSSMYMQPGVQLHLYENTSTNYYNLRNFVTIGNKEQLNNKDFKKELISWMRFNKREVDKEKNGLTYAVIGAPSLPGWISKPIVKCLLTPKRQNNSDLKKIESSSHIALFTITKNTPVYWIETGRSLERFLLKCTEFGIADAFINQPCEEEMLTLQIQIDVLRNDEMPMILLRIGYSEQVPYSPRKPVDEFLLN